MTEAVIGIDLGGSAIRVSIVTKEGKLRNFISIEIPAGREKDFVLVSIKRVLSELITKEESRGNKILAVGIGSPGIIHKGIIVTSPNFAGWRNVPLKLLIEKSTCLPVVLDNDANAAAFGEKWKGAGRRISSMICMTMGTGIGGGIILDGNVWHGADGMSGEVGHITVNPDGPRCNCGNYGCLEAYSSATGMVKIAIEGIRKGRRTILKKLSGGDYSKINAKMIHEAALKGDKLSINILKEAGVYLGIAMASLINILNPEMIVLTGGVTRAWDFFMPHAKEEVAKRAYSAIVKRTRIVKGNIPESAGVVGAAGMAWKMITEIKK